jgi:hypothetical protein
LVVVGQVDPFVTVTHHAPPIDPLAHLTSPVRR